MASDEIIDDRLREALRRIVDQHDVAKDVDDLVIASLVTGELKGDQREKALQEVIASPKAVRRYRILSELHLAAQAPVHPWYRSSRTYGIAASALVMIGVSAAIVSMQQEIISNDMEAVRSARDIGVIPGDNAQLARFPEAFEWPQQSGAIRYRVVVFDANADELWRSDWVDGNKLLTESGQLGGSPGRHFWVVEVDGDVAAGELGPYWFDASAPE